LGLDERDGRGPLPLIPARGLPYFLFDPRGDGSFSQRRDSLDVPLSVPMWTIFTF